MTRATKLPDWNLSLCWVQANIILPTSARGVQVDLVILVSSRKSFIRFVTHVSAPGINFLFMGVSNVTGRMPRTQARSGRPDPSDARLLTS